LAKNNAVQHLQCDISTYNIDVALIVESWFRPYILDKAVSVDNYNIFRNDRTKRKGGGIAAYVREGLACKVIAPNQQVSTVSNLELMWLELVFHSQLFFILCCYHPPKPRYCAYCATELQSVITQDLEYLLAYRTDAIVIVAGDFNSLDTSFLERDFGLQQMVTTVTHGNRTIDKIFLSQPHLFLCTTVKSIVKTKHLAVLLLPNSTRPITVPSSGNRKKVKVYDLSSHNIAYLRFAIHNFDWVRLLSSSTDVSIVYSMFLVNIKALIDMCVPSKTIKIGPRDPGYLTPAVKVLLAKRRKLRRKGCIVEADVIADKINAMICKNRESSLSKLANGATKELWNAVNGSKKHNSIAINGAQLSPDTLNNYFAKVATDPGYNIDRVASYRNSQDDGASYSGFSLHDYQIEPLLRNVKNTAPGMDNLPSWLFRLCSFELAGVIAGMFNLSFSTGRVPEQWLCALVTPVPKIPQPQQLADFRPISVTPILSRIAEKLVVTRWLRPGIPQETIADQFAFKPTGSTTCGLVYFMHHITQMLESNSYVRCMLIDFSKAFDVVNHEILLNKLKVQHLPPFVLNWIISFLVGRSQICKVGDDLSTVCFITRGIIQGSGLGPTLYVTMESDLHPISAINILFKYADDTNLVVPENTDISLAEEFAHIKQWALANKMTINEDKTKEIVFRRPCARRLHMFPSVDCVELVQHAKLLGVILQDNFSLEMHINYVLSLCSQRIYLMKRLRDQGLDQRHLELVFQAIVVTRILYAIPAWGSFLSKELTGRINAFLKRSHRYGFVARIEDVTNMFDKASRDLFAKVQGCKHCLHYILPPHTQYNHELRERGHTFVLPHCVYNLFRFSFVNRCLFKYF